MVAGKKEQPAVGVRQAADSALANAQTDGSIIAGPARFPLRMRQKPRWIGWKWGAKGSDNRWIYFDRASLVAHDGHLWHEDADGNLIRAEKLPICVTTGRAASVSDRSTWCTFEAALEALHNGCIDGLGYVLDKGEALIDLDGCIQGGRVAQFARNLMEKLDTYAEVSVSGQGIHILCPSGDFEPTRGCRAARCEVYVGGHTNRYCTVSGIVLDGYDNLPEDEENAADLFSDFYRTEFAHHPLRHSQGEGRIVFPDEPDGSERVTDERAAALLVGHWHSGWLLFERGDLREWQRMRAEHVGGSDNSRSEADFALAKMLLASTMGNARQTVRLMRRSAMWRPKYDEVHDGSNTYVAMTVRNAMETCDPMAVLNAALRRGEETLRDYPAGFGPLVALMKRDGITHFMLRGVMCTRGRGAARVTWDTPIGRYPLDLMIEHWDEIVDIAYQYNFDKVKGGAPRG